MMSIASHRAFIDSSHALIAVLTPQSSGKPISSSSFGGAESFAPKETKEVALPSWAESAVGRLSVPHSTTNPTVTIASKWNQADRPT